MRPTEIFPQFMIDELVQLHKLRPIWVELEHQSVDAGSHFRCRALVKTWLRDLWVRASDAMAMQAASIWLGEGPKIFTPTKEQCAALEQIDVNLTVTEFAMPFPSLLVKVDYAPFNAVIVHKREEMLVCVLNSPDHEDDITTVVSNDGRIIETSLRRYDEDCSQYVQQSIKALHVACNACLALANFGSHLGFLYPKEVESDRRLASENSERGSRARKRLALAVQSVSFDQNVKLYHKEGASHPDHAKTGTSMPVHWRRGHWAMQPCGKGFSDRKRILRPPVLVRSDLLIGDKSQTSVNYHA